MFFEMDDAHTAAFAVWREAQPAGVVTDAVVGDVDLLLAQGGWQDVRPKVWSVPSLSLDESRASKLQAIDAKTDILIAGGFTVDSRVFSASDAAQLKWLGMYASRTALSYPVTVPTKDDSQFVSLVDTADIETYYNALLSRVQNVLAGGVTLKTQIAAAVSQAALDAIVDART